LIEAPAKRLERWRSASSEGRAWRLPPALLQALSPFALASAQELRMRRIDAHLLEATLYVASASCPPLS
jgi:hypothetical protein